MIEIKFTNLASYKLDLILDHLETNWSASARKRFLQRLSKILEVISYNPMLFPESEIRSGLRKCVLTKQSSLLYTIRKDSIIVVTLFDNRQDSATIIKEIKGRFEE